MGETCEGRMASSEWRIGYSKASRAKTPLFATRHSLFASLSHRFLGLFRALAVVGVEELLAQPDRFRRDLDQLVVLDIGERLFQRHPDRRRQPHRLVLGRGADVGEL